MSECNKTAQSRYSEMIIAAYSVLSEDNKKEIAQCVYKTNPGLFKRWIRDAQISGYTEKSAAARPAQLQTKFDKSFARSGDAYYLQDNVLLCFFSTKYKAWIDYVTENVKDSDANNIENRLLLILEKPEAPYAKSPLRDIFAARALLTAIKWLNDDDVEKEKCPEAKAMPVDRSRDLAEKETVPSLDESAVSPVAEQRSEDELREAEPFGLLRETITIVKREVELAEQVMPFSQERAIIALKHAWQLGETIRKRIEHLRIQLAVPNIEWKNIDELEGQWTDLNGRKLLSANLHEQKQWAASVIDSLKCVSGYRIKSTAIRTKADEAKAKAFVELANAAGTEILFDLPKYNPEKVWLREILELTSIQFDEAVEKLRSAGFQALADFIAFVESWDRLEYSAPIALTSLYPTVGTVVPVSPSSDAVSEQTTNESSQANENEHSGLDAIYNNQSGGDVTRDGNERPTIVQLPVSGSSVDKPTQIRSSGKTEEIMVLSLTSEPKKTERVDEVVIDLAPHLEAVCKYGKRARWATCGYYSKVLESDELPPAAVFNILALLPYISTKDSTAAEAIRHQIDQCESPDQVVKTVALSIWGAALIPACLLVPFSAAPSHLRVIRWPDSLSTLNLLSQETIKLLDVVPHCSAQLLQGSQPRQVWESQMRDIAKDAEQFDRDAQRLTMMYQPATEAWKYLTRTGILSEAIRQLRAARGTGDKKKVQEFLSVTDGPKNILKLVHGIHRTFEPNSRTSIEARAIPHFENKLAPLRDLANRWLMLCDNVPQIAGAVSERLVDYRTHWNVLSRNVLASLKADSDQMNREVAITALEHAFRFVDRAMEGTLTPSTMPNDSVEVITRSLLRVPRLRFDGLRLPVGEKAAQLDALVEGAGEDVDLRLSAQRRLAEKDILGAKHVIELLESEQCEGVSSLRNTFDQVVIEKRTEIALNLKEARRQATRARLGGMIGEGDAAQLDAAFVLLEKDAAEDEKLQWVTAEICRHSTELVKQMAEGKKLLADRVRKEVHNENDRARLERLIAVEDATTVHEYLSRLAAGQKLPAEDSNHLKPFAGFSSARQRELQTSLTGGGELDGLKSAIRNGKSFASMDFSHFENEGRLRDITLLDAWQKVKTAQRAENEKVEIILAGLGYVVQSVRGTSAPGGQHVSEAQVKALDDRALCPIPRFGSLSEGKIRVRHIWNWADEDAIVQAVGETAQVQLLNLVIYYGRLGVERRLALSRICRTKRRSFVVLDELLLAHLCGYSEGRLGAFFRSATPFTYADPFVTASSFVHPEMFFGREGELTALLSSENGRCFVYGGRQLGKTALLREAERRFHNPSLGTFAVWIDMINHGIGSENQPRYVWEVIYREFSRWSDFSETPRKGESGVPDAIETWLAKHTGRRILLLLDEADRFLEADAQDDFREARRLKGIMDRTGRRFKVVFAGLHNVQRTTQHANHPLAHLGEAINVGALSKNGEWHSAFGLAAEPLTALGVEFSSVDLVGRILTNCNFYPGLIQQFCSRLWRALLERRVDGPPFLLTEHDLDEVYQSGLRQDIVSRFKLTLQLDSRYWHLAHVVALAFLEDTQSTEIGYSVTQLRQMAMEWWAEGFANNTPDEFRSLLDEMCDLGVFRVSAGKYSLRNANILLSLGTRSEVETEVISGPRKIAEYKPRSFRARRRGKEVFMRRALTLSEEARLCDRSNGVAFIVGTQILCSDLVGGSLNEVADVGCVYTISNRVNGIAGFKAQAAEHTAASRNNGEGVHLIFVPSNLGWNTTWVDSAREQCERLRSEKRFIRFVFEAGPEQCWDPHFRLDNLISDEKEKVLVLKKWSIDFVAPYLVELGVSSADKDIAEILDVTGGWPELMQEFGKRFSQSGDWRRALATLNEKQTIPSGDIAGKFVGGSRNATAALDVLRKLRSQLNSGEAIHDSDIIVHAELIGVVVEELQRILRVAQLLGLIDCSQVGIKTWDHIFERSVLLT